MLNVILSLFFKFVPVIFLFILALIIILLIIARKKQINKVSTILIKNGFVIDNTFTLKREILSQKNDIKTVVKIINCGKNRGLVITNKDTYFMRLYKDINSSHIDSWKLDNIKTFINQYKNEDKIIILFGGYARITKYINENELEAVTIKNDAFGTKVLSIEDFEIYIKGEN